MWLIRLFSLLLLFGPFAAPQISGVWRFAVSGDSRNCGDVVMPAIAQHVLADNALFYWHLGDFRAIYKIDEDLAQTHPGISVNDYLAGAWNDFIDNQLALFGDTPVFLAFGNHENIPPKTHSQVLAQFADWLNQSPIRNLRVKDDSSDQTIRSYYHWFVSGVDFITLDNSTNSFDTGQMMWLRDLLDSDARDFSVRTLVIGMHEALPDSIAAGHSMNQNGEGAARGRTVADWLANFRFRTRKPVYVLASHSHFYMKGIFNTPAWLQRAAPIPGWIVGTAGAIRYPLPPKSGDALEAKTGIYGYLLATVDVTQTEPIQFEFHGLAESDVSADIVNRYSPGFVHECWVNNIQR